MTDRTDSLQLLKFVDGSGSKLVLDHVALKNLLLREEIKDRLVVVISIAGSAREGKSFLMSFALKYLYFKYTNNREPSVSLNEKSWMGDEDQPLQGFRWKHGFERTTTGIHIWPEIFCTTLANGEEVAIILLDTQGTFDNQTTTENNTKLFAMSTMMSSVQMYNIKNRIEEDKLHQLKLFTDYGAIAAAKEQRHISNAPFGKLLFLVRDAPLTKIGYGYGGGRQLKDKVLRVRDDQKPELKSVRSQLKLAFSDIDGFLMPHPGLEATENEDFGGRLIDLRREFKKCLNELLPSLLAPENLILKTIEGRKINAAEFVQYIDLYVDTFNSDKMPKPSSFVDANAEMSHKLAFEDAIKQYEERMSAMFGTQAEALDPAVLLTNHNVCLEEALTLFRNYKKFRNDDMTASYETKMKEEISQLYDLYKANNQQKKEFNEFKDRISKYVEEITSLRDDKQMQEQRINDLEGNQNRLHETIKNYQGDAKKFSQMEERCEKMDQMTNKQQQEIVDLMKKNNMNQEEIMRLQKKLEENEEPGFWKKLFNTVATVAGLAIGILGAKDASQNSGYMI